MRLKAALAGAAAWLVGPAAAWAQGCVMCRNTAAAGGAEAVPALNVAILVLLVPTLSIFVGILVWAFRYRNRGLGEASPGSNDPSLVLSPPFEDNPTLASVRRH